MANVFNDLVEVAVGTAGSVASVFEPQSIAEIRPVIVTSGTTSSVDTLAGTFAKKVKRINAGDPVFEMDIITTSPGDLAAFVGGAYHAKTTGDGDNITAGVTPTCAEETALNVNIHPICDDTAGERTTSKDDITYLGVFAVVSPDAITISGGSEPDTSIVTVQFYASAQDDFEFIFGASDPSKATYFDTQTSEFVDA